MIKVYVDGSYHSCTNQASIGVYSFGLLFLAEPVKAKNSHEAELFAIRAALEHDNVHDAIIYCDTKTLVHQINNLESVRASILEKYCLCEVASLLNRKNCVLKWCTRRNNGLREAHYLANAVIKHKWKRG